MGSAGSERTSAIVSALTLPARPAVGPSGPRAGADSFGDAQSFFGWGVIILLIVLGAFCCAGIHTEATLAMVKEAKFYRKQAEKAERMSRALSDTEDAQNLSALARAYRSQADMLKKSKKPKKKPRTK
jgi:hypothetical protein